MESLETGLELYVYSKPGGAYTKQCIHRSVGSQLRVPWLETDLFGGSFHSRVLSVFVDFWKSPRLLGRSLVREVLTALNGGTGLFW